MKPILTGAALLLAALAVAAPPPIHTAVAAGPAWTQYHYDAMHSGNDTTVSSFSGVSPGWTSPTLDGEVWAEPLVLGNSVYVATENDTVYALDSSTGSVQWSKTLGHSVDSAGFPCGEHRTLGITSTPVIDAAANVLYAVGLIDTLSLSPRYQHHLFALNLGGSHDVVFDAVVDKPGADPIVQNQRGAITLANGRIYVPYGGLVGDCGNYHGIVTSVMALDGSGLLTFQANQRREGGAWSAGGLPTDGSGNVYMATGNGASSPGDPYDHAESVIKLSPALNMLDAWAPNDWQSLDAGDTDIGSISPLPLGSTGLVFQSGKNGKGYLIRFPSAAPPPRDAEFEASISGGECVGGAAFNGTYIFVGCEDGLKVLRFNPAAPSFSLAWTSTDTCWAESPILAGGAVWWTDRCDNINAADPSTGNSRYAANVGASYHFITPSAGGGRVFVPLRHSITALVLNPSFGHYTALTPYRLLDTRLSGRRLGANGTLDVAVAGQDGLPAIGVGAAALNVTVVSPSDYSYLSVFPTGQSPPGVSNLNFAPGETVANMVQVALGQQGRVTVLNSAGSADVVVDLEGWYASAPTTSTAGLFRALARPTRVLDTRSGVGLSGQFGPQQLRDLDLSAALPDARASAVVLNLTAVTGSQASYLTAFPSGQPRPEASNLNYAAGRTLANRVIVKLGAGHRISLYNDQGGLDVVADLGGWFTDGSDAGAAGGRFHALNPQRLLDTRGGGGLGAGGTLNQVLAGQAGVPGNGVSGVALNVTAVNAGQGSFLTVYPAGQSLPLASDINVGPGETLPNHVVVGLGAGAVTVYNSLGQVDVLMDVFGYYD